MPAHDVPLLDTVDIKGWVDEQAMYFEGGWKAGHRPNIRNFLNAAPSDRRLPLLIELIQLDFEYRRRTGERPSLDTYLQEFSPELVDANHSDIAKLKSFVANQTHPHGAAPTDSLQPKVIGKYQVVRELGRGSQGTVYHAIDSHLGKAVIIKLSNHPIQPATLDRDRILTEGQTLARLNHPHIPRVLHFDVHEGRPCLVLEFVSGRTLEQYITQDKPSATKVATILAKVARALAAAHRAGVTHQDLKPDNILIDDVGEPGVIDFGLARVRHSWQDDNSASGGTPVYMSPEQALCQTDRIQPHSDIFGLGAVLYRVLTGKAPYESPSYPETIRKAQACDFDRDAIHKGGVSPSLASICLRTIEKDPRDRYATADEFADALERAANPPKYGRWILAVGALLFFAFGFAAWRFEWGPFSKPPELKPLAITVHRERIRPRLLARAVPLRPGDTYITDAEIPPHTNAAMFFVDPSGRLERLQDSTAAEAPTLIRHPMPHSDPKITATQSLGGPGGTVLLLALGKTSGSMTDDEVRDILELNDKLSELPEDSVIRIRASSVEAVGDSEDSPRGHPVRYHIDQEAAMKQRLDAVRQRLLERGFSYMEGYAFRQPAQVLED